MSLADKIFTCFKGAKRFTLKEAYENIRTSQLKQFGQGYMKIWALNSNALQRVYIVQLNLKMKSVLLSKVTEEIYPL